MMQEHPFLTRLRMVEPVLRTGHVRSIGSHLIEANGPDVPLGTLCAIDRRHGEPLLAEVVKISDNGVSLAPMADPGSIALGARVSANEAVRSIPAGEALLGRVVNALGVPLMGDPIRSIHTEPFPALPPAPLDRVSPRERVDTGIRAIDSLLTLGRGQRIGIFAPAGVGKTSLVSQLASSVAADHVILCQIGERGREVETLWHEGLTAAVRARATLVAATSDESAAMRARAAAHAVALAAHWRARGKHVLLLIDSATRLAMALRELGLAAGEPPTMRAYTPNVFSMIPRLVECCGAVRGGGAVSAILTVLCEGEEMDDPISEMMKSILDGHILLSRSLAEQGHFPAIDIVRSVSRRAETLVDATHSKSVAKARRLLARYDSARTLIETGLYVAGTDRDIDAAIKARPQLMTFLAQEAGERPSFSRSSALLSDLLRSIG